MNYSLSEIKEILSSLIEINVGKGVVLHHFVDFKFYYFSVDFNIS